MKSYKAIKKYTETKNTALEVPTPHSDTNKINLQIIKDHKTTRVLIAEVFPCYMLRVPSGIIILR